MSLRKTFFFGLGVGVTLTISIGGSLFEVASALAHRPELEALRQQIAANDIAIRVDHNSLLPNLSLSGLYESYGLGGNQYYITATPPVCSSTTSKSKCRRLNREPLLPPGGPANFPTVSAPRLGGPPLLRPLGQHRTQEFESFVLM